MVSTYMISIVFTIYLKLFVLNTDILNHLCVCGAMKSGLMTESLVALVMGVEAIRLESSLIREV